MKISKKLIVKKVILYIEYQCMIFLENMDWVQILNIE